MRTVICASPSVTSPSIPCASNAWCPIPWKLMSSYFIIHLDSLHTSIIMCTKNQYYLDHTSTHFLVMMCHHKKQLIPTVMKPCCIQAIMEISEPITTLDWDEYVSLHVHNYYRQYSTFVYTIPYTDSSHTGVVSPQCGWECVKVECCAVRLFQLVTLVWFLPGVGEDVTL